MSRKISSPQFANIVMLGAVWGFAEAALGLGLHKCAALASGSIMTAVAFFFIAAAWVLTRQAAAVFGAVLLVTLIKLFDALLLGLPVRDGAVANPIFAFWTEALAFLIIIALLKETLAQKKIGQAAAGALSALAAVNVFPLVKYATGIPACVFPGTNYPLSLYYAPIAIGLSLVMVPLGVWLGEKISVAEAQHEALMRSKTFRYFATPAVFILCLIIIAVIRLAG